MEASISNKFKSLLIGGLYLTITVISASCSQTNSQKIESIKIDGSSTVYPITKVVVEQFKAKEQSADINLNVSGTRGGLRKFCAGEIDISNASRPIQEEELQACNSAQVRFIELPIAFDALSVVVNKENTWVKELTVEELKKLWEPGAENKIKRWNQIRNNFPDRPINLYGAGKDSGTFDYFTEAIVGKEDSSRKDYVDSEDDEILAKAISQDVNALGYFGLAYYQKRAPQMNLVAIDNGKGAILPSQETVAKAQYQPLARPLFIYVNAAKAQSNPMLRDFVKYYLDNAEKLATEVGYVPLTEEHYHLALVTFYNGEVGTVFEGKSQFDVTISELLRKKAKFEVVEKTTN
jgi:phosphate transport system substrate-binding protein